MWYLFQIAIFCGTLWFFGDVVLSQQDKFKPGEPQALVIISILAALSITKLLSKIADLFRRRGALSDEHPVNDNFSAADVRLARQFTKAIDRVRGRKNLG